MKRSVFRFLSDAGMSAGSGALEDLGRLDLEDAGARELRRARLGAASRALRATRRKLNLVVVVFGERDRLQRGVSALGCT